MFAGLHDLLLQQPVLVFFLVLSLGYLIGNISVYGISLGSVGGVLIAGLLFGNLGYTMYPGMQTMGFCAFHILRGLPGRAPILRRVDEQRAEIPLIGTGGRCNRFRAGSHARVCARSGTRYVGGPARWRTHNTPLRWRRHRMRYARGWSMPLRDSPTSRC